jgi:hypothetical protein
MKKIILISATLLSLNTFSQSKSIIMEGTYNSKNVFIKNPYGNGGRGFCVTEVFVNGKVTKDEINSSMFQVDLSKAGIKTGEKVRVEIKHNDGCTDPGKPIVMNPGVLINTTNKESSFVIEGVFYWKNFFVSNPRVSGSNDFGINQVLVNGKIMAVDLNADVFEVNLVSLALKEKAIKEGDKIKIEFKYKTGYDPLILNPEY